MAAGIRQERLDDRLQAFEIPTMEFPFGDKFTRPGVRRYERQPRLGAADIARDQHQIASAQVRGSGVANVFRSAVIYRQS